MSISKNYIEALEKRYRKEGKAEKWENFINIKFGASKEDIEKLKETYPDVPNSLIEILQFADGTYHRKYTEEETCLLFFGSDIKEYPYYLLSAKEIIDNYNIAYRYFSDFVDREYDIIQDDRIIDDSKKMRWLHFSDCVNNGGSSSLYIDFSPSATGTYGQIVRYIHDEDGIEVIADSFDEYLQMLIDLGMNFINSYKR